MTSELPQDEQVDTRKKMLRGGIFMSMSPFSSLILGLIVSWQITLFISPSQYGLFEWFNVLSSFFITLIPFRMPNALGRYIAYSIGKEDEVSVERLRKSLTVLSMILVPVSGLVAFLVTPFVLSSVGRGSEYLLIDGLIFTFGVMALNLSAFTKSIASAYREFRSLGIGNFLANVTSQVVVLVLIPLGWGIRALFMKSLVLGLFTAIFLYLTVKNIFSIRGALYPLKPLIKFAYPPIIAFLFAYVLNEVLIRAIFQYYGTLGFGGDLGLYGFASRLVTFVNAFTIGYYSTIGSYYTVALGKSTKDLNDVFQWTVRMSFFVFTPMIVICLVMAPSAFLMVFPHYYWAYQYFAILTIQLYFFLFLRPLHAVLSASAKTEYILASSILASIISGFLMFILIDYGLMLVLVGYISNGLFIALFSVIFVKKSVPDLNLNVAKIWQFSIVAFFALGPAVVVHFLRINPILELVINVTMFVAIYVGATRFLRLVTDSEIRKAMVFLPARLVKPVTKFLILLFIRKSEANHTSMRNQE
ncbi:MAG: lipopolysaccharide biosynthesis protein [Promethearchaeota archaeon]